MPHWLHSPCWLTYRASRLLFGLSIWLEQEVCDRLDAVAAAIAMWGSEKCP